MERRFAETAQRSDITSKPLGDVIDRCSFEIPLSPLTILEIGICNVGGGADEWSPGTLPAVAPWSKAEVSGA